MPLTFNVVLESYRSADSLRATLRPSTRFESSAFRKSRTSWRRACRNPRFRFRRNSVNCAKSVR